MTDLNDENSPEPAQSEQQPAPARPEPEWPRESPMVSDPDIAALVAGLDHLADLPVAEHEAAYGELHDALLQALNADVPSREGHEHGAA